MFFCAELTLLGSLCGAATRCEQAIAMHGSYMLNPLAGRSHTTKMAHLVVPVFKPPEHYRQSIYLGGPQLPRDIFLFFRGDIGLNRPGCKYSSSTNGVLANKLSLGPFLSWL
eukprot:1158319-Pelagomonas_calceolata.AAC.8